MENRVFLSLIIPVYNAEKYLEACFESIKIQDFSDYEVIIVNDGSKDHSGEICDKYAAEDNRVRVFHVENGGPSRARNIGFKEARGKYIYCLDNDDFFSEKTYFRKIYDSLREKQVDILLTGATYYKEAKKCKEVTYEDMPPFTIYEPYEMVEWMVQQRKYETSCWTKVIRREFLIDNGGFFDEDLVVEDLDWNLRLLPKVRTLNVLKCASYAHVYRTGSITAATGERSYKNCLDQITSISRWTSFYEQYTENRKLQMAMLAFLNYQFFITLGRSVTFSGHYRVDICDKLKKIDRITQYAVGRNLKILSFLYRIVGFSITTFLVRMYFMHMRTAAK